LVLVGTQSAMTEAKPAVVIRKVMG
jgi:hypothetical protein